MRERHAWRDCEHLEVWDVVMTSFAASCSLERLSKEPELLRADQEQLKRQAQVRASCIQSTHLNPLTFFGKVSIAQGPPLLVQEASVTHYRAFIEVAKGLGTTQEDLQHADSQLDALLANLHTLSASCEQFAKSTAAYTARRAESKQLLSTSSPPTLHLLAPAVPSPHLAIILRRFCPGKISVHRARKCGVMQSHGSWPSEGNHELT